MRGLVVLAVVLCGTAYADGVEDEIARGEALGKAGEWSQAIEAFKRADAKQPRAKHACLIGLAYTRRELWTEAEVYLALCRQRASASDPLPDWIETAESQLHEKLEKSNAAAVDIKVVPADAVATMKISSVPNETFTPRLIHLPPGSYTITIAAPGYDGARRDIQVTSAAPQTVTFHLHSTAPSHVPLYVIAAGGAIAVAGGLYDVLAVQAARRDLEDAKTNGVYESRTHAFEQKRNVAIGLFAGAALTVVTGIVLRYTVFRRSEPIRLGAEVGPGGGAVTLEWSP